MSDEDEQDLPEEEEEEEEEEDGLSPETDLPEETEDEPEPPTEETSFPEEEDEEMEDPPEAPEEMEDPAETEEAEMEAEPATKTEIEPPPMTTTAEEEYEEIEDDGEEQPRPMTNKSSRALRKKKTAAFKNDDEEEEEMFDDDDIDDEDGIPTRHARIDSGASEPKESGKEARKRKHSISAHLQAELNKQKIVRAKQERETRRGELDAHHVYLMEMVARHLDLKTKEVEEFIIDSPDFMELLENFFEKKGSKSVIFCYQDADPPGPESGRPVLATPAQKGTKIRRLLVTNGSDVPMKGTCMYFLRITNEQKITMKNIADEVYFGVLDIREAEEPGIILESVFNALQIIYLKYLKTNTSWSSISDPETAAQIRLRFLTSVDHYAEFLSDSKNDISSRLDLRDISDMDDIFESHLKNAEDVVDVAKNPEIVAKVEHTVILWCKNIEKVLAISKQMRKETDTMGPLAELAYWRNLMAKMCYIIQQVQQWNVVNFIQVLVHAKSRVLRRWKDVDSRVTDEYHEAKDNVRYMYALEKFCTPLYQTDPPGMIEHINSMMYVIRTIHTTSRYYNTCEKVTALMVKISNQMVAACRRYLTKDGAETVWGQDKKLMLEKLNKCIELYETYRGSYEATKAELEDNPDGKRFNFSVNNIFGRFEQFCDRLKKIIQIVEIFNLYNPVHESHIDGLEVISSRLQNLQKNILKKTYDPLEFRKPDFDTDFVSIRSAIDDIQRSLELFMDNAIEKCPTCMHGLILLERFQNLQNRCLDIESKNFYLFQFYHNEIELLQSIYEAEKNDTPIPRGYPPFAGKIAWARHLYRRLERPMKWFQDKTDILTRDEAKPTIKLFNSTCKKLLFFEMLVHDSWIKTCNFIYDALEAPILTLRGTIRQELVLNFDPFFRQIIEETEIIRKLDLEVPDIAQIVYYKQDKIFKTYERIKGLLERFLMIKTKVPQDLAVLMRPILKKVEKSFMPGVNNINWTSFKAEEYFDYIEVHQNELEEVIKKTHEIITIRINQYLYDISHTMMIDFPDERPMPVQEYMDRIKKYGAIVSRELEYKSRICEQAVSELINMLLRSCDIPTPIETPLIWLNANAPPPPNKDDIVVEKPPVDPSIMPAVMTKEEQAHIYEECRHVFGFYNQKCIEALQKTTRISLDILRQRTEEPQVSKRNPGKTLNRVPLFTSDLLLTIPTIQIKPAVNDMQQLLNRSITMITECLKRVVIWGQNRRASFDQKTNDPFYKDPTRPIEDTSVVPYPRLQAADHLFRDSHQVEYLNARLKNCFKPVMDYKDISKMVLMMQTVVLQSKPKIQNLINQYQHYSFLWKDSRDEEIQAIIDADPVITEIESIVRGYRELEEEIEAITPSHRVGPLEVMTKEMKLGFLMEVKEWKLSVSRHMSDKYKVKAIEIAKFTDECNKDLMTPIRDMNDIRIVMTVLEKIRDKFVDYDLAIPPIEECYSFLHAQKYKIPDDESNRADTLRYNFKKLQTKALEVQEKICGVQEVNKKKLVEAVSKFKTDLQKYIQKYSTSGPMVEGLAAQDASDRLVTFQDEFDELYERYQMCNAGEKLFGFPPTEYPELVKLQRELALLQKLYGLYNDVMRSVDGYFDIKWADLDIQKINAELQEFQNRCRRLPKALKDWPAFEQLKKKIDDFNETCPLLELMTNKSMKDRHWERIGEVTGHKFDLDNENFSLKHVMEAPLLRYKDEVEDICIGAVKEKDIEAKLKQIVLDWSIVQLSFTHFKNRGELLLKGQETSEIMTQLEDALMMLNYLLNNRYSTLYRREIQAHLTDFSNTAQILDNWLAVQNLWIYLEAVFVGGDIARQMPLEAKRFQNIDRNWVKIMNRARENPLVIPCCVGDETMAQILPHLLEQLELCQKSLSGYLESKRKIFPRFFFVSDPVLLEILGQASDSHTIQQHLLSVFENINDLEFHGKEYNKMLSVLSREGEKINLGEPIIAEGNVEAWLGGLLTEQRKSLHEIIRDASYALQATDFDLLEFLATYIAQVGLLGLQILWTKDAEKALSTARRDKKIMKATNDRFLQMLNTLIDQTTKDLSKHERIKFETLITIFVHARDIFDDLVRSNVKSVTDFEWLKQARFYFSFEEDKTLVKITNITFEYQNEFLGCTDRLVITPLTDRCYITIAQACGCSLGAAPAGPADCAKALGKYCVVFNCSDQMDFRGLGRIFKGLAQSGSWGCFDEFNRIELPVLSVAAQQIHIVLHARKEGKEQFIFSDGDTVELSQEVGIIITMNPGYAGRQELPENLKVQFRSIAMIVPDKQIIIRVKLASCGFLDNIVLSRKFFMLYRLCEEQLSKQVHYDFGLRNILSCLRTLGFQKRSRPNDAEETVVMSVLRGMNLSKLVDEDEGLFISLIKDLFPGVNLESVTYPDLQAAIADEVEKAKLINFDNWNLKLIQFYETSLVRHGLMSLGPTGSGKSQMMNILMKAMTQTGTPHKEVRMNPKAFTASQMFGRLDVATNDWTDGIFSTIWRKALKVKKSESLWIVLDGPVDAIWIENLNSVLDDNKTLTLANGDRIVMAASCKLVFEPDNVDNASPATISRVGMVFMSASVLPWQPILQSWLLKRPKQEADLLGMLFNKIFNDILNFVKIGVTPKMSLMECIYVRQACDILVGLLPNRDQSSSGQSAGKQEPVKNFSNNHLEHLFLFSLMWSVGAILELDERQKLEEFLLQHESELDWPKPKSGETIFEYNVAPNGNWEHWSNFVEEYTYPTDSVPEYATILVPNVDNVRTNFLIHLIAKQEKAILLIGEPGSAKTSMIKKYLGDYNPDAQISKTVNFSSETTPGLFQTIIQSYVDKRMGTTYGPPRGRKMTIFIDDISQPVFNEWGDQITNEIVRQLMEMKGIYSLEKPGEFNFIVDIAFMAAMIQPGGGRNDIPNRLKRQFCVFNCTLPSISSMDKIFEVIGTGYFCPQRFGPDVVAIVPQLVSLTRVLWQGTKGKMLPTPAKFHYIFNLRDLSRIWEGILKVRKQEVNDIKTIMALWKHECTRVIADRFISPEDCEWFEKHLHSTVYEELGEDYESALPPEPLFVSFMKDPEDLIESGMSDEDEVPDYPNIYEPVTSIETVKDRLALFMEQYNEVVRGAKMDMVFFRDAVIHILRISRIIRTDRGCAMLVGVGGSGKQSLTKLSSFLGGYDTFQITLTRAYSTSNLMEDLKTLYKLAGQKGHGVSFIFTDNDIKEEGFLEYFNNILSSGEVANLLPREEIDEITNDLIMPMKKEFPKRIPTPDNLYEYFLGRVRRNLHVVLCFSPVGGKFRARAMKFPALVSGCTIDWFSKWPKEALIAVSRHYLGSFPIVCPGETKVQLIEFMGSIHDQVSGICVEYFERFRRQTHVTPKSYLSFLAGYKSVYRDRRKHYELLSKRMDSGLIKLQEAGSQISILSKELAIMEGHLAVASAAAEAVLTDVTVVAESAQKVKDEVTRVKESAEELVKVISTEKQKAEGQLAEARPALQEAEDALKVISPSDISTVRKLGKPPHLIMRIMDCVLLLHYKKLEPYTIDPEKPNFGKPSWGEAMKLLNNIRFLEMLQKFPLDTINAEHLELMSPIMTGEDYTKEKARSVCGNVAGLLSWTKALCVYYGINKEVLPLKMSLALAEGKLVKANKKLETAQVTLGEKEGDLQKVRVIYDNAMSSRQVLLDDANRCKRKMNLASDLINGLGGERERWTEQSKGFKSQIIRLTGDVILLTGFLSYTGPFNQEYRSLLLNSWKLELKKRRIPSSTDMNVVNLLVEPHTIGEWNLHGLPNDELSVQNGIIATKASRFPLMIDPQIQGKSWLKNLEKENGMKITFQNHKYFRNHLEECLSQGKPMLIEDIGEELDPVLDNVLEKNFIKSGTAQKVKLGDTEVEVVPGFRLYMTTKLPNPVYTPEIAARTSIIDFTVTMRGLEDQLLGRVIKTEKEELESERISLIEGVTSNKKKMQELEDNLLYKLSSIQGSLLDDESLVEVLNTTKTTAIDVKEKLFIAAETEKKINAAREEFRPIATRGSVLYFLICEMTMVNVMYQTSLNQFLEIFDTSMQRSEKTPHTLKRIHFITEYLTYEAFRCTCRGLYERHKFMFTLLVALKIDLNKGQIKHQEFQILIKGGAALDLNAAPPKPAPWITDMSWLNLVELQKLQQFQNILIQVPKNERFWKMWFEKEVPEEETAPDGYDKVLDPFRRLLLIRSWCPDRVIAQAKKYIADSLGKRFAAPVILNLDTMYQESRPKTPLCCFLSMGSDPTPQIEALAKRLRIPCRAISMGQGQEVHARSLLSSFMQDGGWALLQNCHLGLDFMQELLETIVDADNPHYTFRLWMTTEEHPKFPISLLQICIKFTNDPPQGIKAGLKRTYTSLPPDTLDYTNAPQWRPMLYAISFLHSVVQERRKFGALGWNIPYEFNWADWAASVMFFQNHLDEMDTKKGVSWITVRYMVGEVHYGGRVTDDYDKRLLLTFCKLWLSDALLQDGFSFSEGYNVPKLKQLDDYVRYIDDLPSNEDPGVYGLNRNAGITYQSNTAKDMLDTILSIQPKDSSSGGGETREATVSKLATELLDKLPPNYVPHRIKERISEMGGLTPMNIFLRQELDRMQKVIKIVRSTLSDLKLAIDGTIIMNESLKDALDSMYDAKVPAIWNRSSWQSTTLGFWFTELLERNNQFSRWINKGRPNTFWMTGFFNPQGFLTAMRQEVTRAHKGWALDQVALHNDVLKQTREEVGGASPPEGVYVYGLFIEGAGWDKNQVKIVEAAPKVLFTPMPVVHIYATDNIKAKEASLYECPVYKKPGRTLLNFINPVWLRSAKSPEYWTVRGVALLCDIK